MPLDHHFGIIVADPAKPWDRKWWKKTDYSTLLSLMLKPVSVHDDLLSYLADTLAWVPCHNPHRGLNHFGLNLHGTTLINSQGAGIAALIFEAWARLFQLGPPRLRLTGNYTVRVGSKKPQAYAKLRL